MSKSSTKKKYFDAYDQMIDDPGNKRIEKGENYGMLGGAGLGALAAFLLRKKLGSAGNVMIPLSAAMGGILGVPAGAIAAEKTMPEDIEEEYLNKKNLFKLLEQNYHSERY